MVESILLYNKEYKNVGLNALAGIFLGADYAGITNLPISLKSDDELKAIFRVVPDQNFYYFERAIPALFSPRSAAKGGEDTSITNKIRESADQIKTITTIFPEVARIGLYDTVIIGTRLNQEGKVTSVLIATFEDLSILQGFTAFYSAYNQYPVNVIILRKNEQGQWMEAPGMISIVDDLSMSSAQDYVAPNKIVVYRDTGEKFELTSQDKLGWKRRDLFDMVRYIAPCSKTITSISLVPESYSLYRIVTICE